MLYENVTGEQVTDMDNGQIVKDFFAEWGRGNMLAAFDKYLHDDAVWHNSGLPSAEGKAACLKAAEGFLSPYPVIDVEIVSFAAQDDVVLAERIDRMKGPDGSAGPEASVNGAMRLRDGKIVYWYDYFDPRPFLG